jgi:hypothetical protein
MLILHNFFRKLTRPDNRHISVQAIAALIVTVAFSLFLSPRSVLAQCQGGDAKFTVNIVQLIPDADAKSIGPPPGVSEEEFERQMALLQPVEVQNRILGLNKAFRPANICFEWDGAVKPVSMNQLRVPGSLLKTDPVLSEAYGKFTLGNRILRFLVVPQIKSGVFGTYEAAGECPRLNIHGVFNDIPDWKEDSTRPDICMIRRTAFSDLKGRFDSDYLVVHEAGHWLGLADAFDADLVWRLTNNKPLGDNSLEDTKQKMRREESAEAVCKTVKPRTIGYDGSPDTPVQPVPAGCDVAFSCNREGNRLKPVPKGNPMDYGYDQAGCKPSGFNAGQIAILKKGAQHRQKP